jgi:hypothetical protein
MCVLLRMAAADAGLGLAVTRVEARRVERRTRALTAGVGEQTLTRAWSQRQTDKGVGIEGQPETKSIGPFRKKRFRSTETIAPPSLIVG